MNFFPLWCFLPVLCLVAWWDVTRMRIPNVLVMAGLVVFVLTVPVLSLEETFLRLLAGLTTLAVCFVFFALRVLGGSNAKMMPVALLFVPNDYLSVYMLGFSLAVTIGMLPFYIVRLEYSAESANWVSMRPNARSPMGVSIALSGMLLALSPALL